MPIGNYLTRHEDLPISIIELIIQSAISGLVGAVAAVLGAIWGARKTLSLYKKQEVRRRKIDVMQRFRCGLASKTSHGPLNEASVAFSDSDEVKKTLSRLHELVDAREPGSHDQNTSLIKQEFENIIRAMYKDVGFDEPK